MLACHDTSTPPFSSESQDLVTVILVLRRGREKNTPSLDQARVGQPSLLKPESVVQQSSEKNSQ